MRTPKVKVTEAQVKKAVNDYLQLQQNMGRLLFLRLQCGSRIIQYGDHFHKLQLCKPGTADFVVIQYLQDFLNPCVTFLEIKSSTGKQSPDQVEFEKKAKAQNCRYIMVNDKTRLEEIL